MRDDIECAPLYAGMSEIQRAIAERARAVGLCLAAAAFQWNSGQALEVPAECITLRVALGPYRNFEETFTPEQLTLGLRDPTVEALVTTAVDILTQRTSPAV
ncbi:MAG: hypothetical protein HY749_09875 [Gammaproteobacteria bacterium]|nr:hypothetical protein [Gammaproteobacteria bacterium]MBI5617786.1 hypothetical protein [Gammaproteobacteria bacterium]